MRKAFLSSFLIVLSACDSLPIVKNKIPWQSSIVDQDCIVKAINATPGVRYDRQEVQDVASKWHYTGSEKKIYSIYYDVLANKEYAEARIRFIEMKDGSVQVEHFAEGEMNAPMSEKDREGFKAAMAQLNLQLQKHCPDAGAM